MNTKNKGDLAELAVAKFLCSHQYAVSFPFGENTPYDLVVESPSFVLYRVQVRWATPKDGRLEVRLRAVSKNYSRTLDFSRIDVFAVYDGEVIYWVPVSLLEDRAATFTLRMDPSANNQKKRVHFAKDYVGLDCLP